MKRLTTETPDGNFETMLNFVFSQDGWAHIRHDGSEGTVPLTQWAKAQCILHGCGEFSAETPQEIDEEISDCLMMDFPDCPIALAYGFAVQACHLRDRLKMYEDLGLGPDEITREQPSCVFYCNRKCNLDGDFCAEGPGCPQELSPADAMQLLKAEEDVPCPNP